LGAKRPVADITPSDVAKLHHALRKTPRTANQVAAIVSKAMNLAEAWGLRPLNSNPVRHLTRFRSSVRERYYSHAELQAAGAAVATVESDLQPGACTAVRLLALTGMRLSEAVKLRWTDADLENGALFIRDAKAGGRRHQIGAATIAYLA